MVERLPSQLLLLLRLLLLLLLLLLLVVLVAVLSWSRPSQGQAAALLQQSQGGVSPGRPAMAG